MELPKPFSDFFEVRNVTKRDDGLVYVNVDSLRSIPASDRGRLLLDLEDKLCLEDPQIRVWHASIGDKNSLRKLRGISLDQK